MLVLLNGFLSHPAVSSVAPFSLIMGPTRAVEAFLLHFDGIDVERYVNPGLERYHSQQQQRQQAWGGPPASYYAKGHRASVSSISSAGHGHEYSSTAWSPSEHSGAGRDRSESTASGNMPPIPQLTTTSSAGNSPSPNMRLPTFPSYGSSSHSHPSPGPHVHHASTANGRTVKALLHTRIDQPPPSVSLSDGFEVRLANENDDLAVRLSRSALYIRKES